MSDRQIKLNFHANSAGLHPPAWQKPYAHEDDGFAIGYYQEIARIAEKGLFDAIFFADMLALQSGVRRQPVFDAVVIVAAIAATTERIGIVATASTTFSDPYTIARQFSTLDHVSRGRAGWNAVTSHLAESAFNYGMAELPPREERYRRAEEFLEVVEKLWDGWDYAALRDPHGKHLKSPAPIDHRGRYFQVRGPLQVPRTPQGRPVIFQAGGSDEGRSLAARHADCVFSAALTLADAQIYSRDVKARAARFGRDADSVKILPGVYVYPASTQAEADRIRARLLEEAGPDRMLRQVTRRFGFEPEGLDPDRPVPEDVIDRALLNAPSRGHMDALVQLLRRERLTLREFVARQPVSGPHRVLVGTPEHIADSLEEWFVADAADGFNVGNMTPEDLAVFVETVVPLLQRRGLYRTHYEGETLRAHYAQKALPPRSAVGGRSDLRSAV